MATATKTPTVSKATSDSLLKNAQKATLSAGSDIFGTPLTSAEKQSLSAKVGTPTPSGAPAVVYTSSGNDYKPQSSAKLLGSKELAELYGITYDENAILSKFNTATDAEYALRRKEAGVNENKFYSNLVNTQGTALDTIRKSNAAAVATGASRGMQAANELSSILGLQQSGIEEATKLADDRALLVDKEAAARAKNIVDSFTESNKVKQALAGLDANKYAADTQFSVGQMDYYAKVDAAAKNLQGLLAQADATKYTADQNLSGNKYVADQNLAGNKYVADQSLAGNKYVADKNLAGTQYTADKNYNGAVYNADKNYAGTVYNADRNLEGQKALAAAQKAAAAASGNGQTPLDANTFGNLLQQFTYEGYLKEGNNPSGYAQLRALLALNGITDSKKQDDVVRAQIKAYEASVLGTGSKTSAVTPAPGRSGIESKPTPISGGFLYK